MVRLAKPERPLVIKLNFINLKKSKLMLPSHDSMNGTAMMLEPISLAK